MGIDYNIARFLFYAARKGCSFERTATIGRQCLYLTADDLTHLLHSFGYGPEKQVGHRLLKEGDGYAEPLFDILKTKTLRSSACRPMKVRQTYANSIVQSTPR